MVREVAFRVTNDLIINCNVLTIMYIIDEYSSYYYERCERLEDKTIIT